MLKKIDGGTVVPNSGFVVQHGSIGHDYTFLEYSEGGKCLHIEAYYPGIFNPLSSDTPWIICIPRKLIWVSPTKEEITSETERQRILDNVMGAVERLKGPHPVEIRYED